MNTVSFLPAEAWTVIGLGVTGLLGIVTIIIQQNYGIKQLRLQAELAREAQETAVTAREEIKEGIKENTVITEKAAAAAEEVKNKLDSIPQQRIATALAHKVGDSKPEFYEIRLPGVDYEPFGWSTGAVVEWKSEWCEHGRRVRFLVHGPASLGFHFHKVVEIIFTMRGTLTYETTDTVVTINPGESYRAEVDAIHSATFEEAGEAICYWPDQDTDNLLIGIYPQ